MTAPAPPRLIAHVDLDAFFASVEVRDFPHLAGRPVVVGGEGGRGVVAAANYEARRFGVHSAMPMTRALQRCPGLVVRPVRMARYAAVSAGFFDILHRYSERVEGLSLDEAYLDLAGVCSPSYPASRLVAELRADVRRELGLAASAGIAPVKFVAKIASDVAKPDGQREVHADEILAFLDPLDIRRLWGVGHKRGEKLRMAGIRTIGALRRLPEAVVLERLGRDGRELAELARGIDRRGVVPRRDRRSVGAEETFRQDIDAPGALEPILDAQCEKVARRLREKGLVALGVALKYRLASFQTLTRQSRLPVPTDSAAVLAGAVAELLRLHPPPEPVRLVGISAFDLQIREPTLPL